MKSDEELIKIIKSCEIFSSMDYEGCAAIAPSFEVFNLKNGEILFKKNDESDAFYIIVSGKLDAVLVNSNSSSIEVLGHMYPGEPVGELGALSESVRSLTVRAAENSCLLKLSSNKFKKLCRDYPSILFEIVSPIIRRSQKTIELMSKEKTINIVLVVAANEMTSLSQFKLYMQNSIASKNDVVMVNESNVEILDLSDMTIHSKTKYHHFIFCFESFNLEFLTKYLNVCDSFYLVAEAGSNYIIRQELLEIIKKTKSEDKCKLILMHADNVKHPRYTQKWLENNNINLHHHIRTSNQLDYDRILRFMMGNPNCLVLGGGAGKGWVHLGVFKALIESNYPIDAIGGTSVGAVAAASYLIGDDFQQITRNFKEIIDGASCATSIKELTWPSVSFMSAKHGTEALQNVLGNYYIEDLWIPFFCISSNLSTHSLYTHRSGLLWEAVRASASMPGIIPPMVIDGHLHVDGGLLNNLPIDVMKGMIGLTSKVIAVKLSNHDVDYKIYNFPPIMTLEKSMLNAFASDENKYVIPPYFDTLLNAFLLGASAKETQNALLANVLINPNLTGFSQYNVSEDQRLQLMSVGYNKMQAYLKDK